MARQADLFGYQRKRPRAAKKLMMQAIDHGCAGYSMPDWKTDNGAYFVCPHCGFDDGWTFNLTDAQIRRGLPCPACDEVWAEVGS